MPILGGRRYVPNSLFCDQKYENMCRTSFRWLVWKGGGGGGSWMIRGLQSLLGWITLLLAWSHMFAIVGMCGGLCPWVSQGNLWWVSVLESNALKEGSNGQWIRRTVHFQSDVFITLVSSSEMSINLKTNHLNSRGLNFQLSSMKLRSSVLLSSQLYCEHHTYGKGLYNVKNFCY